MSLSKKALYLAVATVFCSFSTGCSQMPAQFKDTFASDDPCSNNARNIGTLLGTVGGAILGNIIAKDNRAAGTALGAFTGGLIGGLIGYDIDRRRCELYKIAQANNMDLKMTELKVVDNQGNEELTGLSARIVSDEQFFSGSANPTPKATNAFAQMAQQYLARSVATNDANVKNGLEERQGKMRILLVGHTDDSGDTQFNADLSEQRARAVAKIFEKEGFNSDQIFYQGAGDSLPVADNRTEEGRRQNRRVEMVDLSSDAAFAVFLQTRKPNTAYYRTKAEKPATKKSVAKPKIVSAPKQKSAAKPMIVSAPTSPSNTSGDFIDFGGNDATRNLARVDIGKVQANKSGGFFIKEAAAATNIVASCLEDNYHAANGVKSLSSDNVAQRKTSDYLPGLYNTSWSGMVNGHLVAMTNVSLLRDGGAPASQPELLVYKNYQSNKNATADFRGKPNVNAYQGEKGVLYRVFVEEQNAPIYCIDLVLNNGVASPQSNLIYIKEGKEYQVPYKPSLAKR